PIAATHVRGSHVARGAHFGIFWGFAWRLSSNAPGNTGSRQLGGAEPPGWRGLPPTWRCDGTRCRNSPAAGAPGPVAPKLRSAAAIRERGDDDAADDPIYETPENPVQRHGGHLRRRHRGGSSGDA